MAKETDVQTQCDVKVLLKPNWQRGKTSKYCSSLQSDDIIFENKNVQKNIPDLQLVTPSPKKKKMNVYAKTKETGIVKSFGKSNDHCYWIRCSHKDKVTKEDDCNYCTHQWCIALHYKMERKVKVVPFFCEEHSLKYSEIYTLHETHLY